MNTKQKPCLAAYKSLSLLKELYHELPLGISKNILWVISKEWQPSIPLLVPLKMETTRKDQEERHSNNSNLSYIKQLYIYIYINLQNLCKDNINLTKHMKLYRRYGSRPVTRKQLPLEFENKISLARTSQVILNISRTGCLGSPELLTPHQPKLSLWFRPSR